MAPSNTDGLPAEIQLAFDNLLVLESALEKLCDELGQCTGPSSKISELNELASSQMKQLNKGTEDLKFAGDEQDRIEDVERISKQVQQHEVKYKSLQTALRKANLQAKQNMQKQAMKDREELLQGGLRQRQERKADKESVVASSAELTMALRTAVEMMSKEVNRSAAVAETLGVWGLFGRKQGDIAKNHDTWISPAGYAFSIWGLIYTFLTFFVIYQLLPGTFFPTSKFFFEGTENVINKQISWLFIAACVLNGSWLIVWHLEVIWLSWVVMLSLLGTLGLIYHRLRAGNVASEGGLDDEDTSSEEDEESFPDTRRTSRPSFSGAPNPTTQSASPSSAAAPTVTTPLISRIIQQSGTTRSPLIYPLIYLPFSLYLGWIIVASFVNTFILFAPISDAEHPFGTVPAALTAIVVIGLLGLAFLGWFKRLDVVPPAVFVWALVAIGKGPAMKQFPGEEADRVSETGLVVAGMLGASIALVLVIHLLRFGHKQYKLYRAQSLRPSN
ncbi:hypothetical protein HK102_012828 [Quaeritorhiza haematococci]|nr:hypothetical protein HK102_012828 [Quaeritorhiza haematococci]